MMPVKYAPGDLLALILLSGLAVSCSVKDGAPGSYRKDGAPDSYGKKWDDIPDAVPQEVARSKYGNPASYEVFGKRYYVMDSSEGFRQKGQASWYGTKFHGQRASSGETYNMYAMTAAHKTLPLPTYVEVKNLQNGRTAVVKVNDRGPFHDGRIIDLSYAAATKLGVVAAGTAPVEIRTITKDGNDKPGKTVAGVEDEYIDDQGKLYVQIAAFSAEENALKLITELRENNFQSARIHVDNKDGKLLYRVRIGPVPTDNVAEKVLAQLKEINLNNAKIIRYN
jgi:rare lipoprotein A